MRPLPLPAVTETHAAARIWDHVMWIAKHVAGRYITAVSSNIVFGADIGEYQDESVGS